MGLPSSFYEDDLITDVLGVVKSGKEATVYCCQAHPSTRVELLAAKVYRPRQMRSFKNDAIYQHGRMMFENGRPDSRLSRAARNKSRKGREIQFESWVTAEWQTHNLLYDAGADVPVPVAHSGNAILMKYLGEYQQPAPHLRNVSLAPDEARRLFDIVTRNIELWLACDRVHGDLSAFNILYWNGSVKIIDFPQAVDPSINPGAFSLLLRDITNVCEYFTRYGVQADSSRLATHLWRRYRRAEL